MFNQIKQHFKDLLDDEPGERFQQQFHRRHPDREHPYLKRLLFIGGGVIVIALGILGLPLPGPGTLIIIIGLGLIAQESMPVSKFLDWVEIEVRKCITRSRRWWKEVSILKKIIAVIFVLIILALISWGVFCIGSNVLGR